MTSLSSFINPSHYQKESIGVPFYAAMQAGSTYVAPTFNNSGATADLGGLFGWLIYARSNTAYFNPAKGTTSDSYILYTNPNDLVGDLNKLSGITNALLAQSPGGTAALFTYSGTTITPTTRGLDFIYAINYLAYGGYLVLSGTTTGFDTFENNTNENLDVVIAQNNFGNIAKWIEGKSYVVGVFPTQASNGFTGASTDMLDFSALFNGGISLTGDEAKRIFNIRGTKSQTTASTPEAPTTFDVTSLLDNGSMTYTISTVSDVAGFFARAKNRNELFLTIGGLDRSYVLNGSLNQSTDWNSTERTTLRNKKVNFFVNYTPKFLGSDLVGATGASSITVEDRVGPAKMKQELTQMLNQIGLKYSFEINNTATRDSVYTDIETELNQYSSYLDTTRTQIICDSSNNTDNSSTLNITLIVKPLLGTDSFTINVTFTQ